MKRKQKPDQDDELGAESKREGQEMFARMSPEEKKKHKKIEDEIRAKHEEILLSVPPEMRERLKNPDAYMSNEEREVARKHMKFLDSEAKRRRVLLEPQQSSSVHERKPHPKP